MVGELSRTPLPEVVEYQEGPGILAADFRNAGVPLLRLRNIEGAFVDLNRCNYLDPDKVTRKWSHFRLRANDLLISTSASLGRVSQVTDAAAGAVAYTGLISFRPRDGKIFRDYLRVWLSSREFVEQAEAVAAGSVIRHFGPSHLKRMWISLPSLRNQQIIGEIGRALDDKIELNRRIAETLEGMARALFKSWFVDFDPVHAKAQGRPTGLPDNFAALFPKRLIEDGVPEGWQSHPLPALAHFLNGLALQKYPAQDDEPSLPVIKIAELRGGPTPKSGRASKNVPAAYHVQDGDHLFSWSGSLTHCLWTHGPGVLNQHLFKVSALGEVPDWLIYQAVDHHMPEFQAIASGKAVTMGHIQRHHLDEATVACPPSVLLQAMDAVMSPLHSRSLAATLQSRTLSNLRDTLLPKLISGELRIADAEQRIAAA